MAEDFGLVYDEYVTRIYRFISLKVPSQEIAEDLCSEVFVRALDEFKRTEVENAQAFLYQIARHIIADHYRQNAHYEVVSLEETSEIIDTVDSVFNQAALASEMDQVKQALISIRDEYQDLIIWRYLDELSIPEIAQITEKSEGNVRVGIHRALGAIKEKLLESPINSHADPVFLKK